MLIVTSPLKAQNEPRKAIRHLKNVSDYIPGQVWKHNLQNGCLSQIPQSTMELGVVQI